MYVHDCKHSVCRADVAFCTIWYSYVNRASFIAYLQLLVGEVTTEHVIIPMLAGQRYKSAGTHWCTNWIIIPEQDVFSLPISDHLLSCLQSICSGGFASLVFPITHLHAAQSSSHYDAHLLSYGQLGESCRMHCLWNSA